MKSLIVLILISFTLSNKAISKSFIETLKKIAPFEVYEPEENRFRDWSDEEIDGLFFKHFPKGLSEEKIIEDDDSSYTDLPPQYDFRKEFPYCPIKIRDQGQCGGSFAFASCESFEERLCLASKGEKKLELSPQHLLSCVTQCDGCLGGGKAHPWHYMKIYGITTEECWPYTSQDKKVEDCVLCCKKDGLAFILYKISNYETYSNTTKIKQHLVDSGPVHTSFYVYEDFLSYKAGIYSHVQGAMKGQQQVVIIGYGEEDGKKYWICQNSWGPNWGESGFFRIKMGQCNIEYEAVSGTPIIDSFESKVH